jgi:hypothetical protein
MPIGFVVRHLLGAAPIGLVHRPSHRIGHPLSAYRMAVPFRWRAARPMVWISARRTQEAFLVGIEDGHQRHLGNVQPFAQQVDADQHVEFAQAQVADDLDPLHGIDVRMQVAHA